MRDVTALPSAADVVVVGAGLAGLTAARSLAAHGLDVLLVEREESVGGRVRTDRVGGLLVDRGFQLLNPAYPQLRRHVDLAALDLQPFDAGLVVARGGRRHALADHRRAPRLALASLTAPVGSPAEKAAFVAWAARAAYGPVSRIVDGPDEPYGAALHRARVTGRLRRSVVEPFLAGVLAEDGCESSRRFVELLVRSFVRGTPSLPAQGMQALPEQLAEGVVAGCLHLGTTVRRVTGTTVVTDAGTVTARAVVVAADPRTAAELTGTPPVPMRGLTTFYHLADYSPAPPAHARLLHVDGDRRGPVVNSAVVSAVAPSYAAGRGGALVATTVLGVRDDPGTEQAVRAQLRVLYGADPRPWELVATRAVPEALPAMLPPLDLRRPVDLGDGLFVAGDHRDTASIQGAMASGSRTAAAVLAHLGAPLTTR